MSDQPEMEFDALGEDPASPEPIVQWQPVHRPMQALGGVAGVAIAVTALAVGALAIGALAVGALAIGRLTIGRGRIKTLEIDNLIIRKVQGLG